MSHASHNQPASFCDSDDLALPIVISIVNLSTPCVHGPQSVCCIATVDPIEKKVSLYEYYCPKVFILV